jgi:Hsp70 protein
VKLTTSTVCLVLCACASDVMRPVSHGHGYLQIEGFSQTVESNGWLREAVGIQVNGDAFLPILPKDCKLPCSRPQTIGSFKAGQPRIGFRIFRGDGPSTKNAHNLGLVQVGGYAPRRDDNAKVVVTFRADSSGISVSAEGLALDHYTP